MEVKIIEETANRALIARYGVFRERVEAACGRFVDKDSTQWLDSQDVCMLLNISPRTLQALRSNGKLPYSQISHKVYYKKQDVEKLLDSFPANKE